MIKRFFSFTPHAPAISSISNALEKRYNEHIENQQLQRDEQQIIVLNVLQKLLTNLVNYPERCKSIYLYGEVGRGKSMLMALFFETCPLRQKRRVHFNSFLLEVHAFIHQWKPQKNTDALSELAKKIGSQTRLLCFDEFHVTDIADAMILGRLLSKLFDVGVIVVMTSNRHPNELYQGGIQKEQFLFFIKILQNAVDIIELSAQLDYRLIHQKNNSPRYYFPLDSQAEAFILTHYHQLTQQTSFTETYLSVFNHQIHLMAVHETIALSNFSELCEKPLSAADYLTIAKQFKTVIIANIPQLDASHHNQAKRFVTLIDIFYEHKTRLICTAQVSIPFIYLEGDGAFEFKRTVSRLIEMQSDEYLIK